MLGTNIPTDYYGLSKYIIAKRIVDANTNIVNRRVFAVFDEYEKESRFIKSCIKNYIAKQPMEITQNMMLDFFYIEDLGHLVNIEAILGNNFKDVNMVYTKKYSLLDVANIINTLKSYKVDIIIKKDGMANSYTGNSRILQREGICLIGLERGIELTYENIRKLL